MLWPAERSSVLGWNLFQRFRFDLHKGVESWQSQHEKVVDPEYEGRAYLGLLAGDVDRWLLQTVHYPTWPSYSSFIVSHLVF